MRRWSIWRWDCTAAWAASIALAYWDGRRGQRMQWRVSGQTLEEWRHHGPPVCRVVLERRARTCGAIKEKLHGRPALSMLFGSSGAYDNEQRLLHGTGDLAPLEITINGRPLQPSVFSFRPFQGLWPTRQLFRREYMLSARRHAGLPFTGLEPGGFRHGTLPFAPLRSLRGHPEPPGRPSFPDVARRSGPAGMQLTTKENAYLVVLDGKGLSTNLTTLQFIEDDRFRDFFHKACLFGQDPGLLAIPRF